MYYVEIDIIYSNWKHGLTTEFSFPSTLLSDQYTYNLKYFHALYINNIKRIQRERIQLTKKCLFYIVQMGYEGGGHCTKNMSV